ncbi:MAG: RsmD family RNA methyltransferase [Leptospiraceae bacterium]|nr:RsmD family RNA methyltransferase [Leptospiraceae bacterium]
MGTGAFTRVIAGSLKNRRLPLPSDLGSERSVTTSKIKESAMHMLLSRTVNFSSVVFYDLFAGSGQIGIEALSRGAAACVFVEWDEKRISAIRKLLFELNLQEKASVYRKDGLRMVPQILTETVPRAEAAGAREVVIYADPPYGLERKGRYFADLLLQNWYKSTRNNELKPIFEKAYLLLQIPTPPTRQISPEVYDRITGQADKASRFGKNALALFSHDFADENRAQAAQPV